MEATHSTRFTRPKPYGLAWRNELGRRDARTHKRAFSRPNGIYFLPRLVVGALMTGAAIPTPPIIGSVNKTAKIGDGYKIIHSKYCPNDKFNNNCNYKLLRSLVICHIICNRFKPKMTSL